VTPEKAADTVDKLRRQQASLAQFGSFAFREPGLAAILNEAARICAAGLGAPFCKVCRYRTEENDLLIEAGYGWDAGVVGRVVSQADETSPQGRAFITREPVIIRDIRHGNNLSLPEFYPDHHIVSTIDVVIATLDGQPYGVLEVDSSTLHQYDEHDIDFLKGFANVLAEAVATSQRNAAIQILLAQQQVMSETVAATLFNEKAASALREQFIAVLGHDLRNPLASISGGLTMLRREQPTERRDLLLTMLGSSVSRMAALIDNVLDFARGRLGTGIPVELRHNVQLTPLLEQVVAELQLGTARKAIETHIDLPDPLKCDPSRISQLVSNLLGNALTHGAAATPVHLHANATKAMLTIWITNSGNPIPPAVVERLFEPFFRGEAMASQPGLGLGLHIASEIAKAHGGTLEAASTEQETRFTFRMPIAA
jgi:signal transduction histidine kinase